MWGKKERIEAEHEVLWENGRIEFPFIEMETTPEEADLGSEGSGGQSGYCEAEDVC